MIEGIILFLILVVTGIFAVGSIWVNETERKILRDRDDND